jgi:signal transduction histidine kinase
VRGADPEARPYDLRELRRTGKFAISKPIQGPLTGKWVVPLYQPLHDAAGSLNGAVAVSIDLVNFHPLAAGVALVPETSIRIINGDGLVVASLKDPETEVGKEMRDAEVIKIVLARKRSEVRAAGSDGIERLYGFVPITGTDWHVYAGIPVSVAFAEANRQLLVTTVIGIVVVLLAVALAVIYTREIVLPIRAMADAAHQVAGGNPKTRFRVQGAAEIAEVATQFNHALDALEQGERQLRLLSHRLFEVKETERRELARELHDRIGQNVSTLNLNLGMLRSEMPAEFLLQAAPRLADCEALLHYTGQLVRDLMSDLRPPGLDEIGLVAALHEHARQVTKRSGLSVTVRGTEVQPRPPATTEITLFRIAQEALINVITHARATEIVVTVDSDPERVILTVADNGCGFAAAASPPAGHLGVLGMRERADAIGGRLQVESAPGAGTRVIVQAPRAAPDDHA